MATSSGRALGGILLNMAVCGGKNSCSSFNSYGELLPYFDTATFCLRVIESDQYFSLSILSRSCRKELYFFIVDIIFFYMFFIVDSGSGNRNLSIQKLWQLKCDQCFLSACV